MSIFFLVLAIAFLVITFLPAEEPFEFTLWGKVIVLCGLGILFAWWLHYSP